MKFYESGKALAQNMGVPVSKMEETVEAHFHVGLFPTFLSGKFLDEASGKTGSGRSLTSTSSRERNYVAIITPVIHCCMGGLENDENSAVPGADSQPILGL